MCDRLATIWPISKHLLVKKFQYEITTCSQCVKHKLFLQFLEEISSSLGLAYIVYTDCVFRLSPLPTASALGFEPCRHRSCQYMRRKMFLVFNLEVYETFLY